MGMAGRHPHKILASRLAEVAHGLAAEHGDAEAQVRTYGEIVTAWDSPTSSQAPYLESVRAHYFARGMDPAVYFYEEFLRAYDPAASRKRGVHYSPPEVVAFMIRAVCDVLETEFGERLADAIVVDPCCGVGTFLRALSRVGGRLIGLELSEAASRLAACLVPGAEIRHGNWLDGIDLDLAGRTLVVIGNPPYSGHSANPGKIARLMEDYCRGLAERNPKWLQDDYVKFIRMAQEQVKRAARGVVAFITNHSYLFNPTFRAMRSCLMRDFDRIWVLDLQGNAKRHDVLTGPDESVFPIQMGTAITLLARTGKSGPCEVKYAELRGSRKEKLARLAQARLAEVSWRLVKPTESFNSFTSNSTGERSEYWAFPSVVELFGRKSVGIVTSHDNFAVDFDRDALLERISILRDSSLSEEEVRERYPIGDLDIARARRELQADARWQEKVVSVLYRPFDHRWTYLSPVVMERPRLPFMELMMEDNVAILIGRAGQVTGSSEWDVVFCADRPVDLNVFRRGGATILPRYSYADHVRADNITCSGIDPDTLFYYIYALLHSAAYRSRYAEFLRFDYPRIPFPARLSVLEELAEIGRDLMDAHLLRDTDLMVWDIHVPDQYSLWTTDTLNYTVGGYRVPGKFIEGRAKTGLTEADRRRAARIEEAVGRTIHLRELIDEVVQSRQPWSQPTRRLVKSVAAEARKPSPRD